MRFNEFVPPTPALFPHSSLVLFGASFWAIGERRFRVVVQCSVTFVDPLRTLEMCSLKLNMFHDSRISARLHLSATFPVFHWESADTWRLSPILPWEFCIILVSFLAQKIADPWLNSAPFRLFPPFLREFLSEPDNSRPACMHLCYGLTARGFTRICLEWNGLRSGMVNTHCKTRVWSEFRFWHSSRMDYVGSYCAYPGIRSKCIQFFKFFNVSYF